MLNFYLCLYSQGGGKNKGSKASKKGGGGGKGKGSKKKQPQSASKPGMLPFSDGDVIGIKFKFDEENCKDPVDLYDFDTDDDIDMRKKIEEAMKLRSAG